MLCDRTCDMIKDKIEKEIIKSIKEGKDKEYIEGLRRSVEVINEYY